MNSSEESLMSYVNKDQKDRYKNGLILLYKNPNKTKIWPNIPVLGKIYLIVLVTVQLTGRQGFIL